MWITLYLILKVRQTILGASSLLSTNSKVNVNNISLINVNDSLTNDSQIIANAFNKYFLTVAENIIIENLILMDMIRYQQKFEIKHVICCISFNLYL